MDEMTLLRELGQAPEPTHSCRDAARDRLIAEARSLTISPPSPRRRFSNRVLAAAGAAVLVGGSAWAGLTLTASAPRTATTIECGADTYVPAESGNPIADCRAALERDGGTVPPLAGWIGPTGLVIVLPAGQAPPAGSKPLPSAFQIDVGVRFVTDAVSDQIGPLATGCLTPSSAVRLVQGLVDLAGLSGWHVASPSAPAGSGSCLSYMGYLNPPTQTVGLTSTWIEASTGPPSDVGSRLDSQLHTQLDPAIGGHCLSTNAASTLAERDAAALGIGSSVLTVSDGGAVGQGPTCARAYVIPAGYLDLVVWQVPPASS